MTIRLPGLLLLAWWCSFDAFAQYGAFLPQAQKWIEVEGGYAYSINESTSSLPAKPRVFSPPSGGNWFWGGKVGATWQRTHQASLQLEHVWHNYALDWGSDRTGGSSQGTGVYHGLSVGYGYNVLVNKKRFWWGPQVQVGATLLQHQYTIDEDQYHSYVSTNPQTGHLESTNYWIQFKERPVAVFHTSLGMDGHFMVVPSRFSVGASLKLYHVWTPKVVTYTVHQVTPQQGARQWEIYDGLTNLNVGVQLRYWLGRGSAG